MGVHLIRPIDTITMIGLGMSCYDWIANVYEEFDHLGQGEIWTINAGASCFYHHVVFDMHDEGWVASMNPMYRERVARRRDFLKTHDRPVIMPKADPTIPTSVAYPLGEVIERTKSVYFATGMAYMLALAYCCEVKHLRLFGTDFSYERDRNTHDEQGRACAEYWVGRLVQQGTKLSTSTRTHFMDGHRRSQGHIYGYHERVEMAFPIDGKGNLVPDAHAKFVGPDYVEDKPKPQRKPRVKKPKPVNVVGISTAAGYGETVSQSEAQASVNEAPADAAE